MDRPLYINMTFTALILVKISAHFFSYWYIRRYHSSAIVISQQTNKIWQIRSYQVNLHNCNAGMLISKGMKQELKLCAKRLFPSVIPDSFVAYVLHKANLSVKASDFFSLTSSRFVFFVVFFRYIPCRFLSSNNIEHLSPKLFQQTQRLYFL